MYRRLDCELGTEHCELRTLPMPTIIVDGREIEIPSGRRLNGIQAAQRAGVEIPHYCWHPGLSVVGSCRMCLVEVGTRDAKTGQDHDAAQARAGLQHAGRRRHGHRHQQRESAPGAGDGRRGPAAAASDRLPDLRQGGRMPSCRIIISSYGQDERRADIRPFTSRRRDLGDVSRSSSIAA